MLRRHLMGLALVSVVLLGSAGCDSTPPQHGERLRKAAGLTAFKIRCHKDLWERTGEKYDVKGKITKGINGIITIELSGPQLVDLLRELNRYAHPPGFGNASVPEAQRMYDAIAPAVDAIKATPRGNETVPEVVIDDASSTAPSASTSPSPSTSPSK